MGFMDLKKAYDKVDREDLWQVLKMYKARGKLLGIKSLYVNSVACGRIKGGERECFKSNSGVSEGCIVSPCLFHVDMDGVMREVKKGIEISRGGEEWRLPGLLYASDLVLCDESKGDLEGMD